MPGTTQVSVRISEETKAELEAHTNRLGLTQDHLIQQALLHHFRALREIPADLVIPARLVLTDAAMADIAERIVEHSGPTEALKVLLRT